MGDRVTLCWAGIPMHRVPSTRLSGSTEYYVAYKKSLRGKGDEDVYGYSKGSKYIEGRGGTQHLYPAQNERGKADKKSHTAPHPGR